MVRVYCWAPKGPGSNVGLAGVSTRVTDPSSRPFVAPRSPYLLLYYSGGATIAVVLLAESIVL